MRRTRLCRKTRSRRHQTSGACGETPEFWRIRLRHDPTSSHALSFEIKPRKSPRRGIVLVVALVLLLLFSAMLLGMLRGLTVGVRQSTQKTRQHQSVWLANAGLERAAYRIRRDHKYSGERWEIAADQLATSVTQPSGGDVQTEKPVAIVEIEIQRVAGIEGRRQVTVTADYPAATTLRVRTQKSVIIDLTP